MNAKDKNPAETTGLVELSDDELNVVAGGGPHVRIFDGFTAYGKPFTGSRKSRHLLIHSWKIEEGET